MHLLQSLSSISIPQGEEQKYVHRQPLLSQCPNEFPHQSQCFPPKGEVINHLLHLLVPISPVFLLKDLVPQAPWGTQTPRSHQCMGRKWTWNTNGGREFRHCCTSSFPCHVKTASKTCSQPCVIVTQPRYIHVPLSPLQTPLTSLCTYVLLGFRRVLMTQ